MDRNRGEHKIIVCTACQEVSEHLKRLLGPEGLEVQHYPEWAGLSPEQAAEAAAIVCGPGPINETGWQALQRLRPPEGHPVAPMLILQSESDRKDPHARQAVDGLLQERPHVTVLHWPVRDSVLIAAIGSAVQTRNLQGDYRELQDQFRILTERAPIAFGIVQGQRFVFANRFFAKWSGYTVEELLSMDFPLLVHPQFREMMIDRARRRQAGEPMPEHYEFLAVTREGEERWFDFSPALIEYHGAPAVIGAGLDITTRKRAEQALQRSEASLRLLGQTAARLMMAAKPDETLAGIFEEVANHIQAEIFLNYLVTPDGKRLHLHAWRGLDDRTAKAMEFVEFGQPLCGMVARDRARLVVPQVQHSSGPDEAGIRTLGIRAYACHPLQDSKLFGTISFCSQSRDVFTDEELEVMRAVADQASMALARQSLTIDLEQRAAALDEANQAKDRFLAVLSHELRTPLTPVLAAISMLRRKPGIEPLLHRDLEMIRRNIDLEARLIDDLLDLNRIERGKVELQKKRVDICTVVQQAVEVCRPEFEARQLHFTVNFGNVTGQVEADPARLQQVFWNLLKNAIKFTSPQGCVGVTCRMEEKNVRIEVTDSGAGIEPEALSKIFDAFAQADRNVTREFGGLGLGLSISKSLVQLHGGTIEAHSPGKGRGSTFTVRLPICPPAPAWDTGEPSRELEAAAMAQPLRILLVEDHPDTVEMLKLMLQTQGHVVDTAGDVAGALQKAAATGYDLLVSDLGLPDDSGLELMRELRSRGQHLPGIALSGYGQERDVERSRQAGFVAHLVKPVEMDRLLAAVCDAVRQPMPAGI